MNNKTYRLILSNINSAKVNMATDEALALCYEEGDLPILRLYHWNKSFTLGISQKIKDYDYLKEYSCNYSKRMTGGGVLFHGHDLSYSLVLPISYFEGLSVKESYEKICTFLLCFYSDLGLDTKYVKDEESLSLSKSQFCQVGFESYDIVVNGKKIGGNAQRRAKKFIFQHGSIPIEKNSLKNQNQIGNVLPDFGIEMTYSKAKKLLIDAFKKTFTATLKETELTLKEEEKLAYLLKEKYDI